MKKTGCHLGVPCFIKTFNKPEVVETRENGIGSGQGEAGAGENGEGRDNEKEEEHEQEK